MIRRIEAFGLKVCLGDAREHFVTTFQRVRGSRRVEYQDDWMFATPNLRLVTCHVRSDAMGPFSDHAPIVAEFEVDGATS